MVEEDYVSFEIAKLLKEKGFDWECRGRYSVRSKEFHLDCTRRCNNGGLFEYAAPTHQMARRWLREMHNIFISINLTFSEDPNEYPPLYYVYILDTKTGESLIKYDETNLLVDENKQPRCFAEPEEAVEIALKYVLENLI